MSICSCTKKPLLSRLNYVYKNVYKNNMFIDKYKIFNMIED